MADEQRLKLNPETGYYEGTFTVQVEAEIFRRVLFTYVEDYHIDPLDQAAWEKAIGEVARTAKWLAHPRATVTPVQKQHEPEVEPTPDRAETEEREVPPTTKYLTEKDEKALWDKALHLPMDEWETLLTPLPDELYSNDPRKRPYYVRRMVERRSLEKLREQVQPVSERVEAIAGALNDSRIH